MQTRGGGSSAGNRVEPRCDGIGELKTGFFLLFLEGLVFATEVRWYTRENCNDRLFTVLVRVTTVGYTACTSCIRICFRCGTLTEIGDKGTGSRGDGLCRLLKSIRNAGMYSIGRTRAQVLGAIDLHAIFTKIALRVY